MNPKTHQTVRLSRGKHAGPQHGACVMELASMLSGEAFTDHPKSVCPVIGSFLRTYNDLVDDDRRQDLYRCASKVVASRGPRRLVEARGRHLDRLLADLRIRRRPWTRWIPGCFRDMGRTGIDLVAARTARLIAMHGEELGINVSDVIDDLLALGAAASDRRPITGRGGDPSTNGRSDPSEPEGMLGLGQLLKSSS
jgi:hypothetical protein